MLNNLARWEIVNPARLVGSAAQARAFRDASPKESAVFACTVICQYPCCHQYVLVMLAPGNLCTATRKVPQDALPPIPQCAIDERSAIKPREQGCKRKRDDYGGGVAVEKTFTVQVLHS